MNLQEMLAQLTPESVVTLRRAVELGKWPDGQRLDREQRELCMQALIAWEQLNLSEEQRTGFMPATDCSNKPDDIQTITILGGDSPSQPEH